MINKIIKQRSTRNQATDITYKISEAELQQTINNKPLKTFKVCLKKQLCL